jgi:hypothetical protein
MERYDMTDPLKRECDYSKYSVLPCANKGRELDEYFDTKTHGGPWANLCRECAMAHGYIYSKMTTRFVWSDQYGGYLKTRRLAAHENYNQC